MALHVLLTMLIMGLNSDDNVHVVIEEWISTMSSVYKRNRPAAQSGQALHTFSSQRAPNSSHHKHVGRLTSSINYRHAR